jgi:hypothetical protein
VHVIYAYAADAQFAGSIQTGVESSPIPGSIAAYLFIVLPVSTATNLSLMAGANPSLLSQSLTFTATVTSAAGTPTGNVIFQDLFQNNSTVLGTVALSGGSANLTTLALAPGVHNITARYAGEGNFVPSASPPWTQVVIDTEGTLVTNTTLSAGPAIFFRQRASFSVQVSVFGGPNAKGGSVVLLDGNQQLGPALTLDENGAKTYSTPLRIGTHNIRAVYLGDSTHLGSAGATTVDASPRPKPR